MILHDTSNIFHQPCRRFGASSKDTKLQPPKSWSRTDAQRTPRPRVRRRPTSWAAEVRRQEAISDRYLGHGGDGSGVGRFVPILCLMHTFFCFLFEFWWDIWSFLWQEKSMWKMKIARQGSNLRRSICRCLLPTPILAYYHHQIWTNGQPFVRNTGRIKEKWISDNAFNLRYFFL